MLGGLVSSAVIAGDSAPVVSLAATALGATVFFVSNLVIASLILALRGGQSVVGIIRGDTPTFVGTFLALVPLAWLMSQVYVLAGVGWWAVLLVILPVYLIRLSLGRYIEMRQMFTQTVASLAQAVDARSDWTSGHSQRVQLISVDIGRVMRRSEKELEALEWGGLLHDIGKIGIPDSVLDKPGYLTREERAIMNAHPVIGANIIAPVTRLAPELPIIRHHHEWYNGSGYPDRLMGDEIPVLARILHVADAFEAMTAARPYRLTPLTGEEAMAELRKFAGIQFDPEIVDAFTKTHWAAGIHDTARETEPRPPVPLIAQAGGRMAQAAAAGAKAGGTGTDLAAASTAGGATGTNATGTGTNAANAEGTGTTGGPKALNATDPRAADPSAGGATAPASDPAS
jgi:hypothetical protein